MHSILRTSLSGAGLNVTEDNLTVTVRSVERGSELALKGMTGFGRSEIVTDWGRGYWEARSVNGRGLDMRLNLPSGYERLDQDVRSRVKATFSRGNFQVQLNMERIQADVDLGVDGAKLAALARKSRQMSRLPGVAPASLDGLLSVRGVMKSSGRSEVSLSDVEAAALMAALDAALERLTSTRMEEGAALQSVLIGLVEALEEQVVIAEAEAAKQPELVRERFRKRVEALMGEDGELTEERLAQEAAVFAAKADVLEELDRLKAHLVTARDLMKETNAVGRRLDFLCQELNREANTLCSKSASLAMTNAGLAMKAAIDQFKEQVQNVE